MHCEEALTTILDPVLLCNDLGRVDVSATAGGGREQSIGSRVEDVGYNGQEAEYSNVRSVKEAVRIAQTNNFMGLVCRARLLEMVPALIETIKVAGLVLVSDASSRTASDFKKTGEEEVIMHDPTGGCSLASAQPLFQGVPEGIDGVMRDGGVLRFSDRVDV